MKKVSKINELIQKATKDNYFDSFYEWDSYDKNYDFPVYRLHIGSKIYVWKLPKIIESNNTEKNNNNKKILNEYLLEAIWFNGMYNDPEAIKERLNNPKKRKWSGKRFSVKAVSNEGNF